MLMNVEPGTEEGARLKRIARAIDYLSRHYASQPSLSEAAAVAGLSPSHFQREFTRAAGVSPKSFVAALSFERAKAELDAGAPVLDAALGAGLSGPSRLHDLCLKIEAMTPGSYARGGAGLKIAYGFHPTIFGLALLMATERGLCGLAFGDEGEEEALLADLRARWPNAGFIHDENATGAFAARIFSFSRAPEPAPAGANSDLPIQLFGTPWQIKVWQALIAIGEGKLTSYRAVARTVCTARASRAVGAAVGRNPIALLIPCHRVLATSGALTGYHWGVSRKRALIALEAARASNS
jgi:AraC family transcriptional regulator, regulatory protein of adaptative response / methylated-DNA-[protein]-cysteine methyltransferase